MPKMTMAATVQPITSTGKRGKVTPMKLSSISKEEFMSGSPKPSKGAPPSGRTGRGGYSIMKTRDKMEMPKMRKMEPIKKIDYEGDFEKAFNESLPSKKKSRQQMASGKQNFRDVAQNKADRAVLTKGMKK
jgi:hypothetical protein